MKTVSKMTIIVALILLTTPLAHAQCYGTQWMSGTMLIGLWEGNKRCDALSAKATTEDNAYSLQYMGYVVGVSEAMGWLIEIPTGTTVEQICHVVGKYLDAHPQDWHLPACTLVVAAVLEAYSTPKK